MLQIQATASQLRPHKATDIPERRIQSFSVRLKLWYFLPLAIHLYLVLPAAIHLYLVLRFFEDIDRLKSISLLDVHFADMFGHIFSVKTSLKQTSLPGLILQIRLRSTCFSCNLIAYGMKMSSYIKSQWVRVSNMLQLEVIQYRFESETECQTSPLQV